MRCRRRESRSARTGMSYAEVGATDVAADRWDRRPAGFRAYERSVLLGTGDDTWRFASAAVMEWGVKTRSGFEVRSEDPTIAVTLGHDYTLIARLGPISVHEPARVVAVVRAEDRHGFAYGTRLGHPVSGEEAFVVWRDADDHVWLTLRSLTRPSAGAWRALFPLILVAQQWYRFRYLRALRRARPRAH